MPKGIVLDLGKHQENKFKTYAPWVTGIVAIAALAAVGSFYLGRWDGEQNFFGLDNQEILSPTKEGWFVLETEKFYIEYPKTWQTEETANGVKISKGSAQIELWLDSIREFKLTKKQSARVKAANPSELNIDGRKAQANETVFKNGERFLSIKVPSSKDKVKLTFWVAGNNEEAKKEAVEIIKTFKGT